MKDEELKQRTYYLTTNFPKMNLFQINYYTRAHTQCTYWITSSKTSH